MGDVHGCTSVAEGKEAGSVNRTCKLYCVVNQVGWSKLLERVMGIEPTFEAWEAPVLPLNYTRGSNNC